jgi:hypothetical protein
MPCNRKRGRVVEGSSLENCRRCEPFVSSNLTASAKILKKISPTRWGFFSSSYRGDFNIAVRGLPFQSSNHIERQCTICRQGPCSALRLSAAKDHPHVGVGNDQGRRDCRRWWCPGARVQCAKTIADCFKFRNKIGLDVALEVLCEAWNDKRTTMDDLWRYAEICRVANVMRPYLEAVVAV